MLKTGVRAQVQATAPAPIKDLDCGEFIIIDYRLSEIERRIQEFVEPGMEPHMIFRFIAGTRSKCQEMVGILK